MIMSILGNSMILFYDYTQLILMDEVVYSGNFTLCELDMNMLNGPWLRKVMENGAGGWLRKGTIWDLLISIESHEFDKPDMKPEHDIHQHTATVFLGYVWICHMHSLYMSVPASSLEAHGEGETCGSSSGGP